MNRQNVHQQEIWTWFPMYSYSRRSSFLETFWKKGAFKNFEKFTGKQSLLFNKFEACSFIKQENRAQVFPCKFWKIFRDMFFNRTPLLAASALTRHFKLIFCEFWFFSRFIWFVAVGSIIRPPLYSRQSLTLIFS